MATDMSMARVRALLDLAINALGTWSDILPDDLAIVHKAELRSAVADEAAIARAAGTGAGA